MNSNQLKTERKSLGWTQEETAKRLGVTQACYSMLENGRRNLAPHARKLVSVFSLSPTALPLHEVRETVAPNVLAHELALLGYPGFAHLRGGGRRMNPAEFLLTALTQRNLEARVAEGLPWLVVRYPDMGRDWLLREARAKNLQNRLGFVVTLGRKATGRNDFSTLEQDLVDSKLERQDSFCKELKDSERRWLGEHSSEEAREWNLLSDLKPSDLRYVS